MGKNIKKFLALIFAIVIGVGGFGNIEQTRAAVTNVASQAVASKAVAGQQEYIQDGVTLHCWNWSYKNIEANMALIAASGYTAIQTSPIQQCKEATSHQSMDAWWLYYQPMGFHIDNTGKSALGTKAEFESMVETAHEYGVKVIVDVVANHLANKTGNDLSPEIIDDIEKDPSCWHYNPGGSFVNTNNYDSRYQVTQFCMAGLPDLNTGNNKVQTYVINYLKECIDSGVDGFRFDAAKHIEVPVDTDYCGSEFWPNVINGANTYAATKGKMMYYYGELLDTPGGGIPCSAYTTYMSITDNSWSNQLRGNVCGGNSYGYDSGYYKGNDVYADKLVLWAESHDTFAGGESKEVSKQNINKTWALIAARNAAMSLYFARPASNDLKSVPMGSASITGWSDAEVVAVNKFHNEFVGKSEYISKENGIGYCERGDSGVVLVNLSGNETAVNVKANVIKDGTYKDQITGNTFTVSGGRIKGEMGGTGIAVVYNTTAATAKKNVAYIELPSSWGDKVSCYVYGTDGSNNEWPGKAMTKVSGRIFKYEVPDNIMNPRVIFYSSDSNRYPADLEPGLSLYGDMIYKNGQWTLYSIGGSNNSGISDSGNSGNSGSSDSGNSGSSGSGNSGNNNDSGNNDNGNNSESQSGSDNGDDSGNVSDGDSSVGNDNNKEESDVPIDEDATKDTGESGTESGKDSTVTVGELKEDDDGKKFPWPIVFIPVVIGGAVAGIYFYNKKKSVTDDVDDDVE